MNDKKIGEIIAELRKKNKWTQEELAKRLNVTPKAVSKWENNRGLPDLESQIAMAEIFGVSLDYLLAGKKEEIKIEAIKERKASQKAKLELHNGMINIDELIALDDYDAYQEMINLPASIRELERDLFKRRKGKELLELAIKYNDSQIIEFLKNTDMINLKKYLESDEYSSDCKDEINKKYFLRNNYRISFDKHKIFFEDIINHNDKRFFKKACQTDGEEKNRILMTIVENRPEEYEIQEVLINNGAKLYYHTENGISEDLVLTQMLKNQINILKKEK